MAIPKFYEFMKSALLLLNKADSLKRSAISAQLADEFQLTEEEKTVLIPSGKESLYANRIGWALTYLKKAGLIDSPSKATFVITALGKSVIAKNPDVINVAFLMEFEDFRRFQKKIDGLEKEPPNDKPPESPQEMLDKAYRAIISTLEDDVLREVMKQSPDFFERLVVDLLVSMGYGGSKVENSKVLGKTGDEGIDGVIKEDKLGFDKIYIQAKRWKIDSTVGRPEVQKFVGALTGQGASKGVFITTATFSKEAFDFISRLASCKIVLIDGRNLASLMIEHSIGVSVESTYVIKTLDSNYFQD